MKKLLVLLFVNIFVLNSFSQKPFTTVEAYGRLTLKGNLVPVINIYGEKPIWPRSAFTYFAMVDGKYAQAYAGLSYSPGKTWGFNLCFGIENTPTIYRLAGNFYWGKGKNAVLAIWEKGDGKEGYWYKATYTRTISDNFSIGARVWRYHGVGIPLTWKTKSGVNLWMVPAYDLEDKAKRLVFGLNYTIKAK